MSAKTPLHKAKRKPSKSRPAPAAAASILAMATQNLINMVGVGAVAGTVMLGLLAAKHL